MAMPHTILRERWFWKTAEAPELAPVAAVVPLADEGLELVEDDPDGLLVVLLVLLLGVVKGDAPLTGVAGVVDAEVTGGEAVVGADELLLVAL